MTRRVAALILVAGALGAGPVLSQEASPEAGSGVGHEAGQQARPEPVGDDPGQQVPERITFELRIPPEKGGGSIAGDAGAIETSGESEATLSGGVEIRFRDMVLRADRIYVHRDTLTVEAEGDVIFDQGAQRISASRADVDLATETGSFWNATAYAEPEQYFWGEVVTKTGENTYEVRDGVLTSCTGDPTPDWSLRVARADITIGGYAKVRHTAMRVKKLPIFYWPYMIWPAKTDRASGFLIPNFGYSETRGSSLGLAYYQVMGPSADLTLQFDAYEQTYAGAGAEVRYAVTEGTRGALSYYMLSDRDTNREEWRAVWRHGTSDLPWGLRGVIDVNDYSDYGFFREFQRLERENTRSYLYSNAFISGGWGPHSLSMIVDDRESFLSDGRTSNQRQLPEINYRLRKLKLGRAPLYLSLDTTASYFQTATPGLFDIQYGRFDFAPELTVPLRVAPWMSVAVTASGRTTWWGDSVPVSVVDPDSGATVRMCGDRVAAADEIFCGESLTRSFPVAQVDVVGPSFSKIFDSPGGRFSKFKHLIEPRISYGYVGDFEDQARVPRFDQIDSFSSSEIAEVALVNRIMAKPSNEDRGGAFEIFSFEVAQAFSLRDDQPLQSSRDGALTSKESAIFGTLRYRPSRAFDLKARATYSTLFSGLQSTSLSARAKGQRAAFDLTWYTSYDVEGSRTTSDQARVGIDLSLVPDRLAIGGQVNYNLITSEILQQSAWLSYQSQCWSFILEMREQVTSSYEVRDYRFLLNLKNIGTFLDLNGGNSTARF